MEILKKDLQYRVGFSFIPSIGRVRLNGLEAHFGNLAFERNREVLAVPGSILYPSSQGTNRLIQEGAKLVRDYRDIPEELDLGAVAQQIEMKEILPASDTESLLLKQISTEPTHVDEVYRSSGLPVSAFSSTLAMIELKGLVKSTGNMKYVLAREARQEYRVKVE